LNKVRFFRNGVESSDKTTIKNKQYFCRKNGRRVLNEGGLKNEEIIDDCVINCFLVLFDRWLREPI